LKKSAGANASENLIHSKEEEEQIEQLEETLPNLIKEQTAIQKAKGKDKKRGPTSWQETTF
jgi:hypothetical protein